MDSYEQQNLKTLHGSLIQRHSRLMTDISKAEDKQTNKKIQREIDLVYKLITNMNKLLAFYKEQE